MKKNIVIIGSGIGGLSAGILLSRKGHRVTIFESHSLPGGYTSGFWRKGYYFESGTLSFEQSSLVFNALRELGVYDMLTFERPSYRFLSKDYDGTPATYDEFKQFLTGAYPQQKSELSRYFNEVDKMYYASAAYDQKGFSLSKLLAFLRISMHYRKYRGVTMREFTSRFFPENAPLYRLLSSLTFGQPDALAFILGPVLYSIFDDYWTVKEGFQSLSYALAQQLKNAGGELLLNSHVDRIIIKNGLATGVLCNKTEYPADHVVSASDYKSTFLKLIDENALPTEFREKVRNAPVSESNFVVYLGLAIPNEELHKILKKTYLLFAEKIPGADIRDHNDASYFEHAGFAIYALSLRNQSHAPAGKSSLMISSAASARWMDNWGGGDRHKYQQLKEQVTETLINRMDAFLPGIKGTIEFKDAATPLTFERYTSNTAGASTGWGWNPQTPFYRNIMVSGISTPIKNLSIASCWAKQLGGVTGAIDAGFSCTKKIG